MSLTICGADCCDKCPLRGNACHGCVESGGHPCGGNCVAAECIKKSGFEAFTSCKQVVVDEINALGIEGLHVDDMCLMNGAYVNLEYPLRNGQTVKLLCDKNVYWCAQVEREGNERCFGVSADDDMIAVSEYGCNGADPVLILYKRRSL